jgi:hypothetical protein
MVTSLKGLGPEKGYAKDRLVLSSEREPHINKTATVKE